ncbi:protein NUCLEAR FUSION DEFECTIVE 6, chloroplastic/mitochondrial-like isoform X3 [Olea europaea var. sylvestris]|uniref:Uncharacterized protein n=1 Tax=Olea europaea subsp. europaea TaxID=158383 RepID=A0A8S0T6S3_OLEEU|nr:protein NUCLEAR FUSION DEFECTIVE 6, chloroplastic/mitochondrial-like isoform X3 [Olea europaea var. sylvestris]CAA3000218.1 Hypothetical predicted protein [Olea europaea subsp. europaea]
MERVKEKENEGIIGPTRKPQQNPTFVIGTQDLYPHCFTMAAVAARSCLRSATTSARSAASRFSAGAKPKAASSPFRTSSQSPITARIFRSPVELRSVSAVSMLPYHTATASALLTSMLSVAPRCHAWTLEGL